MTFYIDTSCLAKQFRILKRKNPVLFEAVTKKIEQIASLEEADLQHFKNLRYGLKRYKRAHVGSFVLFFRLEGNVVYFERFEHHDDAY